MDGGMIEIDKIYCEDCRETIGRMEDNSIDCLVTSPPYWALRDYGADAVTIWDSVNGCLHEWGNNITAAGDIRFRGENSTVGANQHFGKDYSPHDSAFCQKCGAWRGSLGLEPDFNLYIRHLCDIFDLFLPKLKKTGTVWVNLGDTYNGSGGAGGDYDIGGLRESQTKYKQVIQNNIQRKSLCCIPDRFKIEMINRGWICRNEIIWHKPNCMPQNVKDRFTVDYEKLFFFVKSPRYYFEQQLEPYDKPLDRWGGDKMRNSSHKYIEIGEPMIGKVGATSMFRKGRLIRPNENGKNKRCVWTLPTQANTESHFAIYPDKLIETPIKAGCPEGGIVYDPFGGSGTTADVCMRLNRNFVISEINSEYVYEIAEKRISYEKSKLKLAL